MVETKPLLLLGTIFLSSVLILGAVYCFFPKLEPHELEHVKLPRNLKDAKNLGVVLSRYKERYFYPVLGGVFVSYIFLQSFAIPGSIFLSVMSGYLFPFPLALLLVCTCSAIGAAICYLLSYLVGRQWVLRLLTRHWPDMVNSWTMEMAKHRDNLLWYMIFLRITPLLPNWFINITAPVLDVPLGVFFWGTFIGVAPPSFLCIQTGITLNKYTNDDTFVFSLYNLAILGFFAAISLLPVLYKARLKEKME